MQPTLDLPPDWLNSPEPLQFHLPNLPATRALGEALGRIAKPGLVVALVGELGAGKTSLVQGLAKGLDVPDPGQVTSPTFTLLMEHHGRLPLFHADGYRLKSPWEWVDLGGDEALAAGGVVCIEWPDRLGQFLPERRLQVSLAHAEGGGRMARLEWLG